MEKLRTMAEGYLLPPEGLNILRTLHAEILRETSMPYARIVLCAMFQSGKSTTTNTLLDGREISLSSIDSGLRTSTGRIEFWPSDREGVEAQWLSLEELVDQISKLSRVKVSLGDVLQKKRRDAALRRLAQRWNEALRDSEDKMVLSDIIQAAILLTYCKAEEFEEYKKLLIGSVQMAMQMMTAPINEAQLKLRFIQQGRLNENSLVERVKRLFPLAHVAFLFVDHVRVDIKSGLLEKLNGQIIDIPGFGVSERDNHVAWKAIADAHVILYIFDGEKEPGELERGYIHSLRNNADCARFVFAVNCRGTVRNDVVDSIRQLLTSAKFQDSPLVIYNARLGNCVAQGHLILKNRVDKPTANVILTRARKLDPDITDVTDAWKEITADSLRPIDRKLARKVADEEINRDVLTRISWYSGYEGLIRSIETAAYANAPGQWKALHGRYMINCLHKARKELRKLYEHAKEEEDQLEKQVRQLEFERFRRALLNEDELKYAMQAMWTQLGMLEVYKAPISFQEKAICLFLEKRLLGIPHSPVAGMLRNINFAPIGVRGFDLLLGLMSKDEFIARTVTFYKERILPTIRKSLVDDAVRIKVASSKIGKKTKGLEFAIAELDSITLMMNLFLI